MTKQQRIILIVGGVLAAYLVYRYQQGQSSSSGSADTSDQAGYSQLAGQEQSDTAALQNAEQNDIGSLTSQLATLGGQEQTDIGGVTAQENGDVSALAGDIGTLSDNINQLATGDATLADSVAALNRSVTVHSGGPFARYYTAVTGKRAPSTIPVSNFIYSAWRAGLHSSQLKGTVNHNHDPKKNGGSVAPSDHGKKPVKSGKPATHPATGHKTSERLRAPAKKPKAKKASRR